MPSLRRLLFMACLAYILGMSGWNVSAQTSQPTSSGYLEPAGGGANPLEPQDELTPEQYQVIERELAQNLALLQQQGKASIDPTADINFTWPLKLLPANDYGYHGVSAFVDHNAAFPNQLRDYGNGTRTYDTSGGYNHAGTDYYLWPFAWRTMNNGTVAVVAAASGTILSKHDGEFDKNCSFNSNQWNSVYILHSNDKVSWYGHLKNGSVTSKAVGFARRTTRIGR